MQKKYRTPKAREGELLVKYGQHQEERDLFYCWPDNEDCMKSDSKLLMYVIERIEVQEGKTLRTLLEERGYDITTFKLTVQKVI